MVGCLQHTLMAAAMSRRASAGVDPGQMRGRDAWLESGYGFGSWSPLRGRMFAWRGCPPSRSGSCFACSLSLSESEIRTQSPLGDPCGPRNPGKTALIQAPPIEKTAA
ncbi:hypothetical protein CV_4299 [Chromobacterium violaceum ATCC 12472]|uniref:Uncharacterized protein n=1 Tax=Chromobacterium violaceum (strain ATCC 12472 / DSM 30191 / JCM 1249 / CCUG 213 / NBRC 12614 / NCIMB 9131 / NCTC 9757 / MK) TaxID=243365 RepID=Q7NQ41_CHRVO|nr:hypothetical protein CV_4299 [Chromobacterium violaceum ATCC 12472]